MHKVRLFLYSIITETLLKKLSEPFCGSLKTVADQLGFLQLFDQSIMSGLYKTEHSGYFILLLNFHVWEDGEAKPCVIT